MSLNANQLAVLRLAAGQMEISYYDVARECGGNGRTLSALADRALLDKIEYPDGSNAWRITPEGRALLAYGVAP